MNKTQLTYHVFNTQADTYQEKYMDVALYAPSLDLFLRSVTRENASVLDVGCGPGNITKYLLTKRPDLKIAGIDLAPAMLELAQKNNPQAEFRTMDCRDITSLPTKFDAIVCGFCLPYLSREEALQLIRDAEKLLNPGGVLYVSTMEGNYSLSGLQTSSSGNQLYMHYHEAAYLLDALQKNSLALIDAKRYITSNGHTETTDLVLLACKASPALA